MKQILPYSIEAEEKVREFWEEQSVPQKARLQHKGKQKFYMMDGPPYASGHIHMGTALNKILKDIAMRMKRMQGFDVRDQPGYDTHGLPIENKVEAKLGFKNKKEIEEFGVEKFVTECKKFATEFIDVMNAEFYDLGVWMDWKKPYLTLDNKYIEGLWWTFKQAHEKGLLYLGKYSVHVCPRCETAVAYNEIEYVKQTDDAVYVKFKVKGENRFLVIWTTTPWTLPGNTGVMVNPNADYIEVEAGSERLVVAKALHEKMFEKIKQRFNVKKEFKGNHLEGLLYENPLEGLISPGKLDNAYRVIPSEKFVNLSEGTGLVHTAPGHGKEDFEEGTRHGLPVLSPVELNGTFNGLAGKYEGKKARETNAEIISDLEEKNALLFKEKYVHDYPVCWRCKTPLLMLASPQWFFAITKIREKLKEFNEQTTWVPSYGKSRFANWLESLGDWPVSRQRYWGTPLPIWMCGKCGEKKVFGSIKELKEHAKVPSDIELHKPWIDKITFACKCRGEMRRVPEVLDVWFDSGSTSWSSLNYPEQKELFEKYWPADVNIEGKDQIRGWWNSQLISSTISFGKKPFNTIVMHGLVLDMNRSKMSKSLGNIVTPKQVIEKQNRDYLRHFLALESRGEDFAFDWDSFKEIHRFYTTLYNVINFLATNLEITGENHDKSPLWEEDKWLLSKLNSVIEECLENYNNYDFSRTISLVENFVLEEVSRTYIQIIRGRAEGKSKKGVSTALSKTIFSILRLLAPVSPHFCEHFYRQLKLPQMPESVHLAGLPVPENEFIDKKLENEMSLAKEAAQAALNLREENKLRRRWPLKKLAIQTKTGSEFSRTLGIISILSNTKKAEESKASPKEDFPKKECTGFSVYLDTTSDTELLDEWEFMELRRKIQEQRKQAGLLPNAKVKAFIDCDDKRFLEKFLGQLEKETNTLLVRSSGQLEKLLNKSFFVRLEKEE